MGFLVSLPLQIFFKLPRKRSLFCYAMGTQFYTNLCIFLGKTQDGAEAGVEHMTTLSLEWMSAQGFGDLSLTPRPSIHSWQEFRVKSGSDTSPSAPPRGFWPLVRMCHGLKLQSLTRNDATPQGSFIYTVSPWWKPHTTNPAKIKGNAAISKPQVSQLSVVFPWGVFVLLWMVV